MLISINWIRSFVDLPKDIDPRDLAERFTRTTAEVDALEPIHIDARGLIVARVLGVDELAESRNLRCATLDVGNGRTVETVTAAPVIRVDANVVYAPQGASVKTLGTINEAKVAGKTSVGMILPGEAIGIAEATQDAIFPGNNLEAGSPLAPELFEDWVMEVDNKSITNRPDLWGHYGVAREIAAIYGLPLKPYPVVSMDELSNPASPEIEIAIADADACPRYSALLVAGVATQPAPLWMQLRLGHVGQRPISGLVDLTNYIMADLGQPMHAFDADKVDRIEVARAKDAERFTTLDGMERHLTTADLMIQSGGRSVALAGVMGGLESEVAESTVTLLLESANFNPATIRKTAGRLGLRTDASARFEKSLDPAHTVLAIQRFIELARPMYSNLVLKSRLSDEFAKTSQPVTVSVNPKHVARTIGHELPTSEIVNILKPLGFTVTEKDAELSIAVPSYRATGDVSIEVDVIEELARFVGYNTIEPVMPRVSVRRFEPNAVHELEQRTLAYFTRVHALHEIHGYCWYDATWCRQLGVDPEQGVELANPASAGLQWMRRSMMPSMFAALVRNRFYFPEVKMIELGSVFEYARPQDQQFRNVGLLSAQRGKRAEHNLYNELKGSVAGWAWEHFGQSVTFSRAATDPHAIWQHPTQTAAIRLGDVDVGIVSVVDLALRRRMDEHLGAWSIAFAELRLDQLATMGRRIESLESIPEFPRVDLDFSILVSKTRAYAEVVDALTAIEHPLLQRISFVSDFEGDAIGADRRSLTFRTVVGANDRTLVDGDAGAFRTAMEQHLTTAGFEIRR